MPREEWKVHTRNKRLIKSIYLIFIWLTMTMQRSHFQAVLLSGRPREQPNCFLLFPSEWQLTDRTGQHAGLCIHLACNGVVKADWNGARLPARFHRPPWLIVWSKNVSKLWEKPITSSRSPPWCIQMSNVTIHPGSYHQKKLTNDHVLKLEVCPWYHNWWSELLPSRADILFHCWRDNKHELTASEPKINNVFI